MNYNTAKLSGYGKSVARAYAQFRKVNELMRAEIEKAQDAGMSSTGIQGALSYHLNTDEQLHDLASVILANEQIAKSKSQVDT